MVIFLLHFYSIWFYLISVCFGKVNEAENWFPFYISGLKNLINKFIEATRNQESFPDTGWPTSAYGVSKLGVSIFTQLKQNELELNEPHRNIKVNSCCPGLVETDMTQGKHEKHLKQTTDEGASTPVYLALLPIHATTPKGCFLQKKEVSPFPPKDS